MDFLLWLILIYVLWNQAKLSRRVKELEDKKDFVPQLAQKVQDVFQASKNEIKKVKEKATSQKVKTEPSQLFVWIKANWTGLLGSLILVAGLVFAAFHIGLSASPFLRFVMIIIAAFALLIASFVTSKWKSFRESSFFLQGASGAVALIGCVGTTFHQSLVFVESNSSKLIILSLGLAFNMLLAFISRKEFLSSFHVLCSLLALAILPSNLASIAAATLITMLGLYLSAKNKWLINSLVTAVSFAIFHYYWFSRIEIDGIENYGLLAVFLVAISALAANYSNNDLLKKYSDTRIYVNLLSVSAIAFQLSLYAAVFKALPYLIFFVAAIIFYAAYKVRKSKSSKLFVPYLVLGEIFALQAILTNDAMQHSSFFTAWLLLIELILFATVASVSAEKKLLNITVVLLGLSSVKFISSTIIAIQHAEQLKSPLSYSLYSLVIVSLIFSLRKYLNAKDQTALYSKSLDTVYAISFLLGSCACFVLYPSYFWLCPALLTLFLANTSVYHHDFAKVSQLVVAVGVSLIATFVLKSEPNLLLQLSTSLTTVIALFALLKSKALVFGKKNKSYAKYLVAGISTFVAAAYFFIFADYSDFLPGLLVLLTSVTTVEIYSKLKKSNKDLSEFFSLAANVFVVAFLVLHAFLHIQTEILFMDIMGMRLLMTLLGLLSAIYVYLKTDSFSFDVIFVLSLCLISLELSQVWQPLGYASFALLFSWLRNSQNLLKARANIYAFIANLIALAQVAFVLSDWYFPNQKWFEESHSSGIFAIVVSIAYAYVTFVNSDPKKIKVARPLLCFLPIFVSLAGFLLWRFDKGWLTSLWVFELFVMIVLGFVVKNKNIIHIALVSLGACIVRLLVYDLDQMDFLIRSVVFVLVGLSMLGIHMIYKKYEHRISG